MYDKIATLHLQVYTYGILDLVNTRCNLLRRYSAHGVTHGQQESS